MSDFLYSEESVMLKQAVCKLMEVSLELGNNRGSVLNGEFGKVDELLGLMKQESETIWRRKNEHFRI